MRTNLLSRVLGVGLGIGLGAGLLSAAPASADVVSGGSLTKDTAVTATIGVAGRDLDYTFAATAGLASTLDVTASAWGTGTAQLDIFTPTGTLYLVCALKTGPSFCEFTPNSTGTWKVRVDPQLTATGSATLKYSTEQQKGALGSGVATTITIGSKGQNAGATFAGTNGLPATFNVTASTWGTGGAARLYFFPPTGPLYDWCDISTAPKQCTVYPNATGTWRVTLDPLEGATGRATLVYAQDLDKGTLAPGTAVTTAVALPYQNARYAFAATANTHVSLDVTATNWGTAGTANLYVYMPDNTLYSICTLARTPTFCDFTPNVGGTWRLGLDPQGAAVGSTTFKLVADQNKGALTVGTTVTTTVAAKGQNAVFTLPATAGREANLHVTGTDFGTGAARLYLYGPVGDNTLYDRCDLAAGTTDCTFHPNSTGTWRITLDPLEAATGTTTVKRTS